MYGARVETRKPPVVASMYTTRGFRPPVTARPLYPPSPGPESITRASKVPAGPSSAKDTVSFAAWK